MHVIVLAGNVICPGGQGWSSINPLRPDAGQRLETAGRLGPEALVPILDRLHQPVTRPCFMGSLLKLVYGIAYSQCPVKKLGYGELVPTTRLENEVTAGLGRLQRICSHLNIQATQGVGSVGEGPPPGSRWPLQSCWKGESGFVDEKDESLGTWALRWDSSF